MTLETFFFCPVLAIDVLLKKGASATTPFLPTLDLANDRLPTLMMRKPVGVRTAIVQTLVPAEVVRLGVFLELGAWRRRFRECQP
jgi:hypothetical protein